jgi:hypothetical protein
MTTIVIDDASLAHGVRLWREAFPVSQAGRSIREASDAVAAYQAWQRDQAPGMCAAVQAVGHSPLIQLRGEWYGFETRAAAVQAVSTYDKRTQPDTVISYDIRNDHTSGRYVVSIRNEIFQMVGYLAPVSQ